jgi:hypothetical protein
VLFLFLSEFGTKSPGCKEPIAHGATNRDPDRPSELYRPDLITDDLAVLGIELPQPLTNRLTSRLRPIERRRQSFYDALCTKNDTL